MKKKNTLSTKHLIAEDIYLFIHYFFFWGGEGWGEVANALRETRHETVKTVNKLGHKK